MNDRHVINICIGSLILSGILMAFGLFLSSSLMALKVAAMLLILLGGSWVVGEVFQRVVRP